MRRKTEKDLLPEFPRTLHLPWKPNTKGDKIASEKEAAVIFTGRTCIQEKIDGANCGMAIVDGFPVIRNRTRIINKGGLRGAANPSTAQFSAVFNWYYENKGKFEALANLCGSVTVYGEWMVQQHGMYYDALPDWFIPFDVYDQEADKYIDPLLAYNHLLEAGFNPIKIEKSVANYEELEVVANMPSNYSTNSIREGVYIKVSDGKWVTDRFKMVRQGFSQGSLFAKEMKRNKLRKE